MVSATKSVFFCGALGVVRGAVSTTLLNFSYPPKSALFATS